MTAHTKGPWLIGESKTRLPIKAGKRTVAYVQMSRRDYEDAHLIAAAPEMLEALKLAFRDPEFFRLGRAARVAIAEAIEAVEEA